MKLLTTLKFTSASSNAMRISRMAALMSSSVGGPFDFRPLKMPYRRSERFSNIQAPLLSRFAFVEFAHERSREIVRVEIFQSPRPSPTPIL